MNQAATPVERLTWDVICAQHSNRWVILADIGWVNDNDFEFTQAEVVATFADRKAASPTMKALIAAGREVACRWTGEQVLPKAGALLR